MATSDFQLGDAPTEPRDRELWLQHAAGFIIFEDIRRYAMEKIDPELSTEARSAVLKGIDDAVYGLMMVIDGVTGGLSNANNRVDIDFVVRLQSRDDDEAIESEVDLREGDGMCMGYHGWLEGDFGTNPVASEAAPKSTKKSPRNKKRK